MNYCLQYLNLKDFSLGAYTLVSGIVYIGSDGRYYASHDTRSLPPQLTKQVIFCHTIKTNLDDKRPIEQTMVAGCEGDKCLINATGKGVVVES